MSFEDTPRALERAADGFARTEASLSDLRLRLLEHPVYARLTTLEAVRTFLEYHCFAVWDFMSLLKALQLRVTGMAIPWLPPDNVRAARMVNEIVVVEETDESPAGGYYTSHYELYLAGMAEIGADTSTLTRFQGLLRNSVPYAEALERAGVPAAPAAFVRASLNACSNQTTHEVAAYFVFGRENIIPDMFRRIIATVAAAEGAASPTLAYYFDRHIGVDELEHGPASKRMVEALCGDDAGRWDGVQRAARAALEARIALWDGVVSALDRPLTAAH